MKNRNSLSPKTRTSIQLKRVLIYTAGAALFAGVMWKVFIGTVVTVASTKQAKAMYTQGTGPQVSGHNWESTITVGQSMVSGNSDLVNFPLLVSVTNGDLKTVANGGYAENAMGYDILFCDDNHAQLTHQLESYDPATGELVAWVNLPLLYHANDTELKITCGNSNITANTSADSTWDSSVEGVWHMNEDPSVANIDDGAGTFDGLSHGAMTSSDLVQGKIGGAIDFDGHNDYIALMDKNYAYNGEITEMTVSSWVKTSHNHNSWTSNWAILDFDRSEYFNFFVHGNGKVSFCSKNASGGIHDFHAGQSGQVNNDEWHHVVATYDGTQKKIYIDGVLIQSAMTPGLAIGSGTTRYGFIGDGSEANSYNGNRNGIYFNGQLDEIRLYNISLSPGRIITEFNNQSDPEAFVSFGNTITNLPIELDYFEANLNEEAGRVSTLWSCVSQNNNDYFTIERSIDGNNFEEIGTIDGAGTTTKTENYKFTDYDPLIGLSYYRLRQTDNDGRTETFNAVSVHYIIPLDEVDIQNVWPNPFVNDFTVEYYLNMPSEITISLYSQHGLQLFSENVLSKEGRNEYRYYSDSELSPGMYFLNIMQNGQVLASKKLLKQ